MTEILKWKVISVQAKAQKKFIGKNLDLEMSYNWKTQKKLQKIQNKQKNLMINRLLVTFKCPKELNQQNRQKKEKKFLKAR